MPVRFSIESISGTARTGWVQTATQRIATPAPVFYTRRGFPPPFTPDVLAAETSIQAVNVSIAHIMDQVDNVAKQGGLDPYLGSCKKAMFLGVRDVFEHQMGAPANDQSISVDTGRGRHQLTLKSYCKAIEAARVDAVASLTDEVAATAGNKRMRKSVDRTLAWLDSVIAARNQTSPETSVFGPIQVLSNEFELARSVRETLTKAVDGYYICGLSLGESRIERRDRLQKATEQLASELPRWAVGLGDPDGIFEGVSCGVDLFDTAYPYQQSELGCALTFETSETAYLTTDSPTASRPYKIDLRDDVHKLDASPLVEGCSCETCRRHTRAYIHHLLNTREIIADVLLNTHNAHHYSLFFAAIRRAVSSGNIEQYRIGFERARASIPSA